mmetsp:Transcript_133141/g.371145  ORF Transcript_133141/g.371145 Transcript_133141/m.371145 type:complete len:203 (-) Transcript_133141:1844-2452(-)
MDAKRRPEPQLAVRDLAAQDQWALPATGERPEHHWEHNVFVGIAPGRLPEGLHELVQSSFQLVDAPRSHDPHAVLLGLVLRGSADLRVEGQDQRALGPPLLSHDGGALHIPLLHLADTRVEDWELPRPQQAEQRLQLAELTGLHQDPSVLPLKASEAAVQLCLSLRLELLQVVPATDDPESRPGHHGVEPRCEDLDTHGGAH